MLHPEYVLLTSVLCCPNRVGGSVQLKLTEELNFRVTLTRLYTN